MADATFNLAVILKAIDHLSGPLKTATRNLESLNRVAEQGRRLQAWGQQAQVMGALTEGAAARMRGGLGSVLRPTMEIQDAMASLATIITPMEGTVTDAMGRMKAAATDWSLAHTDSAADFIRTSYMMVSAGLNELQATEATRTAMTVAKATMGNSVEAANLLATVYNNMGDKTRDAGEELRRLGDVLTATQQTFQIANLGQLTDGMKYAIPVAKQYGISIEQASLIVGALNTAGVQGSQAGTALSSTMSKMLEASKQLRFGVARTAEGGVDLVGTIRNMEARFGALSDLSPRMQMRLQKAFGQEGIRLISLMAGKSDELGTTLGQLAAGVDVAAKAQATMEATASGKWQSVINHVTALKDTIGQALLPMIDLVIPAIRGLVDWMRGFVEQHPVLSKVALGFAAVATAVLTVVGPIALVVGSIANMVGFAMVGFAKLGAGFTRLSLRVGTARVAVAGYARSLWQTAVASRFGTTALWAWTRAASRAAVGGVVALPARIAALAVALRAQGAAAWASLRATIAASGGLIGLAISSAAAVVPAVVAATVAIKAMGIALLTNPITWIVVAIAAGAALIYKFWKPISGFFKGLFSGIWQGLAPLREAFSALGGAVMPVFRAIWGVIRPVVNLIGSLFSWLGRLLAPVEDVGGAAQSMGRTVGRVIGSLVSTIVMLPIKIVQFVASLPAQLGELAAKAVLYFGGVFKRFGPKMVEAGKNILLSIVRGIKAVLMAPVRLIEWVVGKIRSFLPFSPAKVGPLKDIHRLKLVETIAATIRPRPMVQAMQRASTGLRSAVPRTLPMPQLLVPSPAGAGAGVGGGLTINVTYSPHVTVGSEADLARAGDALRPSSEEMIDGIARRVLAYLERRNSRRFT